MRKMLKEVSLLSVLLFFGFTSCKKSIVPSANAVGQNTSATDPKLKINTIVTGK